LNNRRAKILATVTTLIVVAAIACVFAFVQKNVYLTGKVAGLTALSDEQQLINDAAQDELFALREENDTMKNQLDGYISEAEANISLPRSEYAVYIDSRVRPELTDMLSRHITALNSDDLEKYKATISPPDSEYLLERFETYKNTDIRVTAMFIPSNLPADDEMYENGGFYLTVTVASGAGEDSTYFIGVTKQSGEWLVYDYD
jgi:hypothetical protein